MPILENIQMLCEQQNISVPKLEKELGLGKGSIYKWSKSSPTADKLQKIANYFKVSTDYLLDRGSIYDLGQSLKEEREEQGLSAQELGDEIGLSEYEITQYEDEGAPITLETATKICEILGMSYHEFLAKYELYDAQINPEFNDDIDRHVAFKNAVDKDAMGEGLPPLTSKDERDIARDLEKLLANLDSNAGMAFYDGEPLDDESRELLKISLENSMRLAKQMAKKKFTPKKYRK